MTKRDRRNLYLKALSLVMAVSLWLFITNEDLMFKEKKVTGVQVKAINLAKGLEASYPERVEVFIIGVPKKAESINAFIDLKGKGPGVHEVQVQVKQMTGTKVIAVKPNQVKVVITEVRDKVFPLSYIIDAPLPPGYELKGVEINPKKCVVEGERKELKSIAEVAVKLDLSQVKDTLILRLEPQALAIDGATVTDKVRIMPEEVKAYVIVGKKDITQKLLVKPVLTGQLASGFEVVEVKVVPEEVVALGSEIAVGELSFLETEPVDLTGRDASFTKEVEVKKPLEVELFPSRVQVLVEIKKTEP